MSYAHTIWPLLLLACTGTTEPAARGDSAPGGPDGGDSDGGDSDGGDSDGGCDDPCETPSTASIDSRLDAFTASAALTRDNPLKGLMTSYQWGAPASDFPDQLEFLYLPMADLWGAHGDTLDAGLEPHLAAAEGRGHHAVIRVYIDYPAQESGLPPHLADAVPCQPYDDHGGGCAPDYDDPDLVEAMTGLIAAMGARYDADPRLGFVQVGLLGFWGEWHTWPYEDWFPTEATQDVVLSAYEAAFATTQLQVRIPAASSPTMRIGFHDDSFAYSTIGDVDWFFLPALEAAGAADRWREVLIGGEIRPELQSTIFEADYETGTYAQDLLECVEATHASYLLDYQAFSEDGIGYTGEERASAEAAALALGYQLSVRGATLSATGLLEGTVEAQIAVEITQTGVAPFYYALHLTIDADALASSVTGGEDLRGLPPGETREVTVDLGRVSVDLLNAPLTLGLTSPMLQPGQTIAFATAGPLTGETGALTVAWAIGCEGEGGASFAPGEVAGVTADGCDCVCDVDGQRRACGGEICDPL